MEIMQVMGRLVCTQRVEGLGHMHLRILCNNCLLYTSPSPRDRTRSRMPSSA